MPSIHHPVLIGRAAHRLLEHPAQVMRILDPHFIGDLTHGLARAGQQVLDTVDDGEMDVLDCRLPRLFLDEVAEIVCRKVELSGTPADGG